MNYIKHGVTWYQVIIWIWYDSLFWWYDNDLIWYDWYDDWYDNDTKSDRYLKYMIDKWYTIYYIILYWFIYYNHI